MVLSHHGHGATRAGTLVRMIELHTMGPAFGLPTYTPFGLKVIAFLELTGLPYRTVVEHRPGRGPKGKFPWLVDGDVTLADSGFILGYLQERYEVDLDRALEPEQQVVAHTLRRMVEESLCHCISYYRWVDAPTYRAATDVILASIPRPIRALIRPLVRRRILRDLWGQGIARHGAEEVAALGCADLEALAVQLGSRAFIMGERPRSVDASVASFLAVLLAAPFDNPLQRRANELDNLVRYTERMTERCFRSK